MSRIFLSLGEREQIVTSQMSAITSMFNAWTVLGLSGIIGVSVLPTRKPELDPLQGTKQSGIFCEPDL
jgi:hypothetical protein